MKIIFKRSIEKINDHYVVRIPIEDSKMLTSRGMLMGDVRIGHWKAIIPIEPDGQKSHWFELPKDMVEKKKWMGKTLSIAVNEMDTWTSPTLPLSLRFALEEHELIPFWNHLTPRAQWDWIRWIRSTKNQATLDKRIHVAMDKMKRGEKRPCCFDRTRCTIEEVSKSGVLLPSDENK